jgi:hypothetical protein
MGRCAGLSSKKMGGVLIAGVVGVAVGAFGYYTYLASKSGAVAGLGLFNVTRTPMGRMGIYMPEPRVVKHSQFKGVRYYS